MAPRMGQVHRGDLTRRLENQGVPTIKYSVFYLGEVYRQTVYSLSV